LRKVIAGKGAVAVNPNIPFRATKYRSTATLPQQHLVECCFSNSGSSDASLLASRKPQELARTFRRQKAQVAN
jgi:hypothetical protein